MYIATGLRTRSIFIQVQVQVLPFSSSPSSSSAKILSFSSSSLGWQNTKSTFCLIANESSLNLHSTTSKKSSF